MFVVEEKPTHNNIKKKKLIIKKEKKKLNPIHINQIKFVISFLTTLQDIICLYLFFF